MFVCLLCKCLPEDASKRDYCGLHGCVADICAVYAYAIGNMDVKSFDTLNYLLFYLHLHFPTFRPPLRLKWSSFYLPYTNALYRVRSKISLSPCFFESQGSHVPAPMSRVGLQMAIHGFRTVFEEEKARCTTGAVFRPLLYFFFSH